MAVIVLANFSGEQPHITPRLMPENAAMVAQNVRLDDGSLKPMNYSSIDSSPDGADLWQSLHKYQGSWIGWSVPVHAVPGPVAADRLYYTGDGAPKVRVDLSTVYPLAIPRPSAALTLSKTGTGTGDKHTRLYVYTWVTSLGEESEPSAASAPMDWQDGETITLAGFDATPAGRTITHQRIYRSQTGTSGTSFYFIAERAASASDYVDTVPIDDFLEPLPSLHFNAPPDTLKGLISLPNGMMAAFDGKKLYFCEPWQPHAWPEKYILTTDFNIVALGAAGPSLIVLTDGYPYLVTGSTPDTMQMQRIEQNYPCINARAVVDLGYAIAFPTHEGLALVDPSGAIRLATLNIFSRLQWLTYSPLTIIGGNLAGRYAAFFDTTDSLGALKRGVLLIDPSGAGFLSRMDISGRACWSSVEESLLYFVDNAGAVRIADSPNASRTTLFWHSKPFFTPTPVNFAAVKISTQSDMTQEEIAARDALIDDIIAHNEAVYLAGFSFGPVGTMLVGDTMIGGDDLLDVPDQISIIMTVNVYADDALVHSITSADGIARLPGGFLAHKWEIEVYSNQTIDRIAMATSVEELKQIP